MNYPKMADEKTQVNANKLAADSPSVPGTSEKQSSMTDDKTPQSVKTLEDMVEKTPKCVKKSAAGRPLKKDTPEELKIMIYDKNQLVVKNLAVEDEKAQKSVQKLAPDISFVTCSSEKKISNIQQSLILMAGDLPLLARHMKNFSEKMRSLYVEEKISITVENGEEFNTLRDAIKNDAVAYLKGVLPLNEICLLKLQEYFSYYESLEFDEWKKSVPDILTEVAAEGEGCQALVKVYESYLNTFNQRQDKAKDLHDKFKNLKVKYEKEVSELDEKSNKTTILGAETISSLYLAGREIIYGSVKKELAKAVAKTQQLKIVLKASETVTMLMTDLEEIINCLKNVAKFFEIILNELESFDEKIENEKNRHYTMIKNESSKIKLGCRNFHGVLPEVKTNFQAIPTGGTENYVDQWLRDVEKIIDDNCNRLARKCLMNAVEAAISFAKCLEN